MRVFLTGASGYLGSHAAHALVRAGHRVTALLRRPGAGTLPGESGVHVVTGDLEHPDSWMPALRECDGLLHCAAMVRSWGRDPEAFDRVNVEGAMALVEAAAEAGLGRILATSSLFALGPTPAGEIRDETAADLPPSPLTRANDYVRTKAAASGRLRALQKHGHPVMTAFPTVLLGPGPRTAGNHTARVLEDVATGRLPGLVGDGEQVWNLVPVEDAARGLVLALERGHPGEGYILGGENWTQRKLVERAAHLLGVKAPLRRLGRGFPLAVATASEAWARLAGRDPFLTRGEVRLYDAHWAFSSAKAIRELGYAPGDVEAALAHTIAWLRSPGADIEVSR